VATNQLVEDRNVSTSNHFNQPTYYIGRDGQVDNIRGGAAADKFEGLGGNDTFEGRGGDDILKGGTGDDIAVFADDCDNYTITHNADGSVWTVSEKVAGRDGTDTLTGMEYVQFGNEIHRLELGHSICDGGEDLCLVIDTTGSMSDDIEAVKAAARDLVHQVFNSGEGSSASRISIVGFKDPGETQILLSFTNQANAADREAAAIAAINRITVDGGGDIPEGDYSALIVALNGSAGAWREEANVRRVVLFTDAPAKDASLAPQVNALARDVLGAHTSFAAALGDSDSTGAATTPDGVPINRSAEIYGVVVGSDTSALASVTAIANDNSGLVFHADTAANVVDSLVEAVATPYLVAANGTAGNDTINGTIVADRIVGLDGNDTIHGLDGGDYLVGGAGIDTLFGEAGNDRLDGGDGADAMTGGTGDDTYIVDNVADVVTELAGEGTDTIKSYITLTLGSNFENLELLGFGATAAIGNTQNNIMTGNTAGNFMNGGGGSDALYGEEGNDVLVGDFSAAWTLDLAGGGNNTIATARPITAFTLEADANIQNSTSQPHATVFGVGDDTYRVYSLKVTKTGITATFDIDFGAQTPISFDPHLRLYNSAGTVLADNDDASTSLGGGGSTSSLDSYLQFTFSTVGTYYIEVARNSHLVVPAGDTYQLQVSVSDLTGVTGSLVSAGPTGGNDILAGGTGTDTLTGGAGDDRFVFARGDGTDTVTDFAAGVHTDDRIDLTAFHATFAGVLAHASQSGANTVFNLGIGDTLTLQNVTKTALSAEDFAGLKVTRSDFSANGDSDILWHRDNGADSIWDDGQIGNAHIIANTGAVPSSWHIAGKGDFDGNGHNDVLWRNDNGAVSIWDNGTIGGAHIIADAGAVPNSWHISGIGDFDGNGQSDILWRNDNGAASIWDNGAIGNAHIIANAGIVPNSWHISGIGDFDADGLSDILWRNDSGAVSIWDNGQIGNAHIIANAGAVPNSWHISGTGDFDGNGHDDILWRNDNGAASIWDNGQIGGAHIIANAGVVPNSWHIADTGDYDGNGHSDILWRNDNGAVSIWDNGQIGAAHIIANPGVVPNEWHIV
jgi:Ca2+-binding RTX toxin-like protein